MRIRFYVIMMGLAVAVFGIAAAPGGLIAHVQGDGCGIGGACTYYFNDNSTAGGKCGQNTNNQECTCAWNELSQEQDACGPYIPD